MKSRIVCYRLEGKPGPRSLSMPKGSEILAAGYHQGAVGLWVRLVDATETSDMHSHTFELFETGGTVEGPVRYLGTCAAPGGTFCLHVAERIEPDDVERHPERTLAQRVEDLEERHEEDMRITREATEALERRLAEPDPCGELIGGLSARLEMLEKAPRVLARIVDPENGEAAS